MAKYILELAGNINWMAVFALLTFMFIFVTSCILVFTKNQSHINKMSHLPLEDGELAQNSQNI